MRAIYLVLIVFCFAACSQNKSADKEKENEIQPPLDSSAIKEKSATNVAGSKPLIPDTSVRMNIFKNTEISGYGYDILIGEKLYIHQPNIPAVEGNNGFSTEQKARRAAAYIIHKIKMNIMPPSVSARELDSIGAR
jgi:hypothetical protein